MLLRVLILVKGKVDAARNVEYDRLKAYLKASGQIREAVSLYESEEEGYEACRTYLPDLVIAKEDSPVLGRVTRDLRTPVLVLNDTARAPLYCTTSSVELFQRLRRSRPGLLFFYEAADPDWYKWEEAPRNIRVCSPPGSYADYLQEQGVNVFIVKQRVPWKVNDILNCSQIALAVETEGLKTVGWDFGHDEFKIATCGAMLMSPHSWFFAQNEEMVKFDGKEDLLRLVRFYLQNPKERARIAQNGREKAAEIWTAWHSWAHVFEKMGFPAPDFIRHTKSWKLHQKLIRSIEQ